MAVMTMEELLSRRLHVVTRTERGLAVVRRDPRALPRRLRLLLLSIDGGQTVQVYEQTLQGFGDVPALLTELLSLGLVQLQAPHEARANAAPDSQSALDLLLEDSDFNSQIVTEMLYGTTTPGSFEEMLRVSQQTTPNLIATLAAPPAPAPVSEQVQETQMASLFALLEATRGERLMLKNQLTKMHKLKKAGSRLLKENKRLERLVLTLFLFCMSLVVMLLWALLRR